MKKKRMIEDRDEEDCASVSSLSSSNSDSSDDDKPLMNVKKKEMVYNTDHANSENTECEHQDMITVNKKEDKQNTNKDILHEPLGDSDTSMCGDSEYEQHEEKKSGQKREESANGSSSDTSMDSGNEIDEVKEDQSDNKRRKADGKDEKKSLKKRKSAKNDNKVSRKFTNMLKYLRLCGVHIRNYSKIYEGCTTMKLKEKKISEMLEELGVSGRPTIEKCKKIKLKREIANEVSELDTSNIIKAIRRSAAAPLKIKQKADTSSGRYIFGDLADLVDSETSENEQENKEHCIVSNSDKSRKKRLVLSDSDSEQDKENECVI